MIKHNGGNGRGKLREPHLESTNRLGHLRQRVLLLQGFDDRLFYLTRL